LQAVAEPIETATHLAEEHVPQTTSNEMVDSADASTEQEEKTDEEHDPDVMIGERRHQ
jgi:hypothetical protein